MLSHYHVVMVEKETYKIGQVAAKTKLKPFVLRFWESEFPQLEPIRTEKGQRLYTDEHLHLIEKIKTLLYGEGLTIDGARKRLSEAEVVAEAGDAAVGAALRDIYEELLAIRRLLEPPKPE